MSIVILTGPPAAGKNSVAPLVAKQRPRCAVVDVDQVRWMLIQPHVAPWEGAEGKRQCILGVENACWLASRFAADGCDVLLLDYLWDYTVPIYRSVLAKHNPKIVLLLPSRMETLKRNAARGWLPAAEVEMLYTQIERLRGFDLHIDNSAMSVETLASKLLAWMDSAGSRLP